MTIIKITTDYITLGQFLKLANIVSSGGMVKPFLMENNVDVNDKPENRRGRKIRIDDKILVLNETFLIQ